MYFNGICPYTPWSLTARATSVSSSIPRYIDDIVVKAYKDTLANPYIDKVLNTHIGDDYKG